MIVILCENPIEKSNKLIIMILSSLNSLFSLFKYDLCVVELSRLATVGVAFKRHKKRRNHFRLFSYMQTYD